MEYWQYHNQKMKELKQIYNRTSKQTQNKLQEIFDSFNVKFEDLYKIADNKTKKKINIYIEEWKDKRLLTGYFGVLANNIYKRTRVKNSEILELLIYGVYIEEQSKLQETELNTFKDVVNYYYQEGQKEVNKTLPKKKRKIVSIIPDAIFLALLDMPNYSGYNWEQYIQTILQYNAQQIYKQVILNIQQQRELEIQNNEFQRLINQQNNQKLCIRDNKMSGSVDMQMIGLNNLAKVEGIKRFDKKAKVQFISDQCEHVTMMCSNMDRMVFNVNDWNEFDRWYGEREKELKIERIKVFGLVLGINLPTIMHHFHYCHSYIIYLPPVEKEEKTEYNGLASSTTNTIKKHPKPKLLEKINYNSLKEVIECLKKYEKITQNSNIENAIVITKDGKVYQCYGNNRNVWVDYDLENELKEAYVTHNHPKDETQYSFSEDDIVLFNNYNLKILRGIDSKYKYELTRNSKEIDEITIEDLMKEENGMHALNINRASSLNIGYRRWKND